MILFFDTETTGKVDLRSPPGAPHQPRLVQLAAILTDDSGDEVASLNAIVKPREFKIPKEASDIHGITNDLASTRGIPALHALLPFGSMANNARLCVAHNSDFDIHVMDGECLRFSVDFPHLNVFCTMRAMTPVCKLPGNYGDYKWPRLQEAYRHAFNKEFDGAHDALADVRACKEVYFWLKAKGNDNGK